MLKSEPFRQYLETVPTNKLDIQDVKHISKTQLDIKHVKHNSKHQFDIQFVKQVPKQSRDIQCVKHVFGHNTWHPIRETHFEWYNLFDTIKIQFMWNTAFSNGHKHKWTVRKKKVWKPHNLTRLVTFFGARRLWVTENARNGLALRERESEFKRATSDTLCFRYFWVRRGWVTESVCKALALRKRELWCKRAPLGITLF